MRYLLDSLLGDLSFASRACRSKGNRHGGVVASACLFGQGGSGMQGLPGCPNLVIIWPLLPCKGAAFAAVHEEGSPRKWYNLRLAMSLRHCTKSLPCTPFTWTLLRAMQGGEPATELGRRERRPSHLSGFASSSPFPPCLSPKSTFPSSPSPSPCTWCIPVVGFPVASESHLFPDFANKEHLAAPSA